jgi:hypothetical protein
MIGRRMGFFNKIFFFYGFIVIMTILKDVLAEKWLELGNK